MSNTQKLEINLETLRQVGERVGVVAAAFYAGFCDGYTAETQRQKEVAVEKDEIPDDCKRCWCNECANFDNCIVPIEGYDIESEPCPCDGCQKGQRYMPKENSPCENYIPAQRVNSDADD